MKHTLVITVLFFASSLFADQPPDIGHFKGLAFSSATDRHPVEINGGNLVRCEVDPNSHLEITKCDVEKGSVVVTGTEWNSLSVKLSRVTVLQTKGTSTRNYYFRGTADLVIGGQPVTVETKVSLGVEEAFPNRIRGFIGLPDQGVRTSLEAYLVP
jgi:hypothetical protein